MLAGALITVAITATVTWLVAKRSQKAQRELERDKPRLQHESQLELKAEEEAKREQTAEKHAIAYRQKLISGLCNLQIFKMSSPLNLEDVYVKLQVRQEEKLPYAKEEERISLGERTTPRTGKKPANEDSGRKSTYSLANGDCIRARIEIA
jgi:hypothetical protein